MKKYKEKRLYAAKKEVLKIVKYNEKYTTSAIEIWNDIVENGIAFPQTELLDEKSGNVFSIHNHLLVLPLIQIRMKS